MSDKRLSIGEAAERIGKTRRTLENWRARGADGFYKIGSTPYVDIEKLQTWLNSTGKNKPKKIYQSGASKNENEGFANSQGAGTLTYSEARRRKEIALAKKHEWDLSVKKGDYIHKDELLALMNKIGSTLKARLIAQPSRLCSRFANIEDPRDLQREWDTEQWSLLNSISKEFGVPVDG